MKKLFLSILMLHVFAYAIEQKEADWIKLTPKNWKKIIEQSEKPMIVYVASDSCTACVAMTHTLYRIYRQFKHCYEFAKINFRAHSNFCINDLNVVAMPTFIFFKDGKELKRVVGAYEKNEFQKLMHDVFVYS
jgi:thioredoxin 1